MALLQVEHDNKLEKLIYFHRKTFFSPTKFRVHSSLIFPT